jgi:hypothetical protein
MPDEAREVVFPTGVPVQMVENQSAESRRKHVTTDSKSRSRSNRRRDLVDEISDAEGNLISEAKQIDGQARRARRPEGTANLLES